MKRKMAFLLAALLLVAGCGKPAADEATPEAEFLRDAHRLIQAAPDIIWLYQDEIKVDHTAQPYIGLLGMAYYPVVGYDSIAALQTHSRTVFTEDFCQNALYAEALDPQKPKFVEPDGKLLETRSVGGMGWIESLVMDTLELVELSEDKGIVSVYSQSLLGTVSRQEFVCYKEPEGWRLDNYYKLNQTEPVEPLPTLTELAVQLGAQGNPAQMTIEAPVQITIDTPTKTGILLDTPDYYQPFLEVLKVLEYRADTDVVVLEIPEADLPAGGALRFVLQYQDGDYEFLVAPSGLTYLTTPSGVINRQDLAYQSGWTLLSELVSAVQWEQVRVGGENQTPTKASNSGAKPSKENRE